MKKLKFLYFVTMVLFVAMTSCSDDDDDKKGGGTVVPSVEKMSYIAGNTGMTDIFQANITYKNQEDKLVTLTNVNLPWEHVQEVSLPFKASLSVEYILKENATIPDEIKVGHDVTIKSVAGGAVYGVSNTFTISKTKLNDWLNGTRNKISIEFDFIKE